MEMILRIELEGGMQEEILKYLETDYGDLVAQIRDNGHIKILQKTRGILKETSVGRVSGPMLRYQDGSSTETLRIPLFGRAKEVPMEGYALDRGKTDRRVRMQADLAPSGMARTLALLSGGEFLSTLYILRTYSVRVHESSRVWDYTVGEEREGYKVLDIEDNTVYLGYDEEWYFSSVVPEERWFPDAPVPFSIEEVLGVTEVYAQGIALDMRGRFRKGLTFYPWVKHDEVATCAWKWHKYYNGSGGVLSDAFKVFRVNLEDLSPEALSILIGKVEGDMNKLYLRGLTKGYTSRLEYDDYVSTREEINREQDEEIFSELRQDARYDPKTGDWRSVTNAPVKAMLGQRGRSPDFDDVPRRNRSDWIGARRNLNPVFQEMPVKPYSKRGRRERTEKMIQRRSVSKRSREGSISSPKPVKVERGGTSSLVRRAKTGVKFSRRKPINPRKLRI